MGQALSYRHHPWDGWPLTGADTMLRISVPTASLTRKLRKLERWTEEGIDAKEARQTL
jgi:hypothetical protein